MILLNLSLPVFTSALQKCSCFAVFCKTAISKLFTCSRLSHFLQIQNAGLVWKQISRVKKKMFSWKISNLNQTKITFICIEQLNSSASSLHNCLFGFVHSSNWARLPSLFCPPRLNKGPELLFSKCFPSFCPAHASVTGLPGWAWQGQTGHPVLQF